MGICAVVVMVVTMFMCVVMVFVIVIMSFVVMFLMIVTFAMFVMAILGIAAQCHVICVQKFQLWRIRAAAAGRPIQPRGQFRTEPDQKPCRLQRLRIGRAHLVMVNAGT